MKTLVTFLLDRSSSMNRVRSDTIDGFNTYVETLQQSSVADDISFNFLQFDSRSIDRIHDDVPIRFVRKLDRSTFVPRGKTPLIDAVAKTISAVERSLEAGAVDKRAPLFCERPTKVVVAILTDGQENCSVEHTWSELTALIKAKLDAGWEFVFLGLSINAYAQGRRMGISVDKTMSMAGDSASVRASYASMAANVMAFAASGASVDMNFRPDQKHAANDRFDPKHKGPTP